VGWIESLNLPIEDRIISFHLLPLEDRNISSYNSSPLRKDLALFISSPLRGEDKGGGEYFKCRWKF